MPVVIRALESVKVPVLVVADFDILRVERDVELTYDALGGDWTTQSAKRALLDAALQSDAKPLRKSVAKDALTERLATSNEVLTRSDVDALRAILKADTGWDKVKRSGLSAVPQGNAFQAAEGLLNDLARQRLFVVPVGELERFAPGVPGHGPGWVNEVLEQRTHESPSADAISFVTAIEESAKLASGTPVL